MPKQFHEEILDVLKRCPERNGKIIMRQIDIAYAFGKNRGKIDRNLIKQVCWNIGLLERMGKVRTYGKQGNRRGGFDNPVLVELVKR